MCCESGVCKNRIKKHNIAVDIMFHSSTTLIHIFFLSYSAKSNMFQLFCLIILNKQTKNTSVVLSGLWLHVNRQAFLPGPHASLCVPVKCWVPERERSRCWEGGAAGCHRVDERVCTSECPKRCRPAWGHRRSGRGGLRRGAAPAPGCSRSRERGENRYDHLSIVCLGFGWRCKTAIISLCRG